MCVSVGQASMASRKSSSADTSASADPNALSASESWTSEQFRASPGASALVPPAPRRLPFEADAVPGVNGLALMLTGTGGWGRSTRNRDAPQAIVASVSCNLAVGS